MKVSAALLLYSAVAGVFGPALMRRLQDPSHSPRTALGLWLSLDASILLSLGAVMSVLFVVKSRLSRRSPESRALSFLPDVDTLEQNAYALHVMAFPLWTFTLIAGAIWAEQAWGAYWQWDPKEVWTFVIWVVYAAYLHARATSGWSREAAASIAVAGYAAILINYMVVNVYFVGMHSYSGM